MLPPGLDNRNPHRYGQLIISIHTQSLKSTRIQKVQLTLLGMKRPEQRYISSGTALFDFSIATNMWFFYAYLHDTRIINFKLTDTSGNVYNCQTTLNLLPSHNVLNKNNNDLSFLFEKNSYLLNRNSKEEVFDSKFAKIGKAEIVMQLAFEESINRTLFAASLIDFDDILVIDEISPIGSTVELHEEPQSYNPPVPKIQLKQSSVKDRNVPESLRYFQEEKQVQALPEDDLNADEKMMQDDIDRLIAQMQSKPYDSSKYMEEDHQQPKQENINRTNFLATSQQQFPYQKRSTQKKNSAEKIPQKLPPMMKSQTLKQEYSLSPHDKLAFTATEPVVHYQQSPALSQTQRRSSFAETEPARDHQKRTGLIRLKIHEFTMSKMQKQLSLLLKIYLNQDSDQFYSVNGLKQGESISFNSNVKIDQRREIDTISFVMIDAFDMKTVFAQGTFQMSRLFSQNPTKGVFMVNLLSPPTQLQQSMAKVVRIEEQSLVRVVPNLKNLRIQLEYQEPIDIVQIYLSLANFSSQCRKICYKIPLTRQTIQFRVSQLSNGRHMNIFPHNRSSHNRTADRIIIELWGDVDLIGFNEISLKQISNTNQSIINSSLQPILLYDQTREVVDIKNAKSKASYWFKLYYGTVAQVQSILNREDNRQKRVELPKKPVEVEKHLGIYIKQAKKSKQVEIQADETHVQDVWRGSQKNILQLQQEELPDDDEDEEEYVEDNHKESSENQFISPSIEQKYMNGRETIPIPKMNPSSQQSQRPSKVQMSQLSQTLKSKTLSSLTKKFQQQISEVLSDFSTEQQLQQLKEQCQPYLLYNFIQTNTLVQILRGMGISQAKIDYLLKDIIPVTNELINVNILYDMILALILEGEVKEKFIDDAQIGRFCLMVLYRQSKNDQQKEEVIFDQNTEFDESRKFFDAIGYRITMREFNLIHIYLKKQSEAGLAFKKVKQNLQQLHLKKMKEEEVKQAKEKEIVSKLYQHEWDQDDDFFICNINQHNNQSQEISINPTINDAASHKSKQIQENTQLFKAANNNPFKKENTEVKIPSTVSIPPSQRSRSKDKESFKATERQTPKTKVNFSLTIEGFQKCIETTECLLNISLTAPKLKITHRCSSSNQQSWINFNQKQQGYELQFLIEDSQFFQGSIELVDSSTSLAKCNVSVMSGMKSCYSLKNTQTQQFCGILKLLLTPLQ